MSQVDSSIAPQQGWLEFQNFKNKIGKFSITYGSGSHVLANILSHMTDF